MDEADLIERPTARVIVLDPANRILMFEAMIGYSVEPDWRPDATTFWALPGGGIEAGEVAEAAARRELAEETGLRVNGVLPLVATRTSHYPWKGRRYIARENFFFHRSATSVIDAGGWLEGDRRWMRDLGWWTLEKLETSNEIIRPPGLASLARRLQEGHIPDRRLVLSA